METTHSFMLPEPLGGTRRRVWDGIGDNWLSGHHNNKSGAFFHNGWIMGEGTDYYGNDWFVSMDQKSLVRTNKGEYQFTGGGGIPPGGISINDGDTDETSDWACAFVAVYNRELTSAEYEAVENYAFNKFMVNSIGTEGNPATNPMEILEAKPSSPDGIYWYDFGDGEHPVYTDFTNGGYLLVAKIQNIGEWEQGGSRWWASVAVNEAGCTNTTGGVDSLGRGYFEYTATEGFRLSMGSVDNSLSVSYPDVTAKNAFTGAFFDVSDQLTRNDILDWVENAGGPTRASWGDLGNCNQRGFNFESNFSHTSGRFGITLNNENDCNSNDACLGFGVRRATGPKSVSGSVRTYPGTTETYFDGWIWVK